MASKPKMVASAPNPHLVRSLAKTRRWLGGSVGIAATLGSGFGILAIETRLLAGTATTFEWVAACGLTAFSAIHFARAAAATWPARLRSEGDPLAAMLDLDHAVALQIAAHGIGRLALGGGADGFWCTVLATILGGSLGQRSTAIVSASVAIGLEVLPACLASVPGSPSHTVLVHVVVLIVLTVVLSGIVRGQAVRAGQRAQLRLQRELERLQEQARSYRLVEQDSGAEAKRANPEQLQRSSVAEIQTAVRFALDLLKRSLDAHTAVLLFQTHGSKDPRSGTARTRDADRSLRVADVVTDATAIAEGPFSLGDGVLGAVSRRRSTVSLSGLRPSYRVPYYPRPLGEGEISALVAAPVLEGSTVRGVLCVDRKPRVEDGVRVERPFSVAEEELVAAAARFVLRAVENERVFSRLERAKCEQDQLYAAAQRLSGALTEAEVIEAGVESARAIAAFDLVAITIVHEPDAGARRGEGQRLHEVRAVAGAADFEALVGLRFVDNGSLVSQAVKNRCTLPHRGDHDPDTQVVFTRRHPLRVALRPGGPDEVVSEERTAEVRSVLVVPLTLRDRALGTLVLGARRRGAFREWSLSADGSGSVHGASQHGGSDSSARTTLEVLASHIATSLANARMFAKLEELATTDGLTGLLNKRVLLELGTQKVRAAARYHRPLAVIQTDIDFFKKVNDTHGHDVGDQVIRGLAGILRRLKRSTDYVARFGGEEFVVLCEETDAQGAMTLAERVREELERTTFHAASGPFQVTCSLGVAVYPHDGTTWESLYKATDEALYASKRAGRNRATLAPGTTSKGPTAASA